MNVVYFVSGDARYLDYCQMSIDTVRKACPDARIHLYTDLPDGIEGVTMHEQTEDAPLMVRNTHVWRDFCGSHEGETIFLDPDVLMVRKPDLLFLRDLAFTWRDNLGDFSKRMPWNTGVVFARCGKASAVFFDEMATRVKAMPKDDQKWYGNQLALSDMVGSPDRLITTKWKQERHALWAARESFGAYISELPCDMYNWTPEGDEPLMNRYFVHLKGNRKHRMKPLRDQLVTE